MAPLHYQTLAVMMMIIKAALICAVFAEGLDNEDMKAVSFTKYWGKGPRILNLVSRIAGKGFYSFPFTLAFLLLLWYLC